MSNIIYTYEQAISIVEIFEDLLSEYNIRVPSPEDYQREPDNDAAFYGSIYADLVDKVEERLVDILNQHKVNTKIVINEFSGDIKGGE